MMNWLAEILPLFFVRWYSRKYLMRMNLGSHLVTNPRNGIFLCVNEQYREGDPRFSSDYCTHSPTERHAYSEHEGYRKHKRKGLRACVWCGANETIQL